MCDTFVLMPDFTASGALVFGKNSDRDPNEPHEVLFVPRMTNDEETVKCTYIEVPQVDETLAVFLSKPSWIWGCEMGANEKGVVMGNEAVFTRRKVPRVGLLGMDLMRLALERAGTAAEAVKVLGGLIETHGQGGQAGYDRKTTYDNSFIIADQGGDAWVLESAGHSWVAEHVKGGIRSISNGLTIETAWDLASPDVAPGTNFRKKHSDFIYTRGSKCALRRAITESFPASIGKESRVDDVLAAFATLRVHHGGVTGGGAGNDGAGWEPRKGSMGDICMHAKPSFLRPSQTTGSLVAMLFPDGRENLFWFTGTSAPCTSIFKPFTFKGGLPVEFPRPARQFDDASLWWVHEKVHRSIIRDYRNRIGVVQEDRDLLEREFIDEALRLVEMDAPAAGWKDFQAGCYRRAMEKESEWYEALASRPVQGKPWDAWRRLNDRAGISGMIV